MALLAGLFGGGGKAESRTSVVNDVMVSALLKTSQNCFTGLSASNSIGLEASCPDGQAAALRGVHQTSAVDINGGSCSLTAGVESDTEAKLRNALKSSATSDKDGLGGFLDDLVSKGSSSITDVSNSLRQASTIETLNSCFSDLASTNNITADSFCTAEDVTQNASLLAAGSKCFNKVDAIQRAIAKMQTDAESEAVTKTHGFLDSIANVVLYVAIAGVVGAVGLFGMKYIGSRRAQADGGPAPV